VLRIWESKVAASLRDRDLEAAEGWMRAVTEDPVYPPEFAEQVSAAMEAVSRPSLIDDLVVWLVDQDAIDAGGPLLAEWGEPVVRRLIELMAVDDPPVNRRHLVEILGLIGKSDSRLLIAHVGDPRWFVVRNVAIALGRTGRLAAMPALRSLLSHEDHRVRVEALRGLAALDNDAAVPDLVRAFGDDNPRVRRAIISLLRASPSDQVIPLLSAVIETGQLNAAESERLVEVIGERNDPEADAVLRRLAGKRVAFGTAKAARDAARREMRRRSS
jgi:HEAT repeat protein